MGPIHQVGKFYVKRITIELILLKKNKNGKEFSKNNYFASKF